MRRRPGIQGLQRTQAAKVGWGAVKLRIFYPIICTGQPMPWPGRIPRSMQESFKVLGDHVNQTKLELMRGQMAMFKQSLEEFAIKYKWG